MSAAVTTLWAFPPPPPTRRLRARGLLVLWEMQNRLWKEQQGFHESTPEFLGTTLAAAVLALAKDPEGTKIKAAKARDFVRQHSERRWAC